MLQAGAHPSGRRRTLRPGPRHARCPTAGPPSKTSPAKVSPRPGKVPRTVAPCRAAGPCPSAPVIDELISDAPPSTSRVRLANRQRRRGRGRRRPRGVAWSSARAPSAMPTVGDASTCGAADGPSRRPRRDGATAASRSRRQSPRPSPPDGVGDPPSLDVEGLRSLTRPRRRLARPMAARGCDPSPPTSPSSTTRGQPRRPPRRAVAAACCPAHPRP